ncbi:MAG: hypothetical protein GF344_04835, partial [Chitinivibrionales bacterium]|nr:hypothetical protein [Chitinivibrionales bacterium]MBD3356333.1 hypothetical protein [Chitinivibrionales bacterium]
MKQSSRFDTAFQSMAFFIVVFINALFVLKYAPRINAPSMLSATVYSFLLFVLGWGYGSKASFLKSKLLPFIFFPLLFVFIATSICLLRIVPPETLRVDRWSAIAAFLSHLFEGKYPYLAPNHLGQYASPMPMIHVIALPFYLIGDIGYLQVVAFAGSSLFLWFKISHRSALLFLGLISVSPAFWWEIVARSDLSTNMLAAALFVVIADKWLNKDQFTKPIAWGVASALLLCTRGLTAIPLLIFFSPLFFRHFPRSLQYLGSGIGTFVLTFLPFYFWDPSAFISHNPLILQTNKTHPFIQIAALAAAFFFGLRPTDARKTVFTTSVIIFLVMLFTFVRTAIQVSLMTTLYESMFDISYFTASLPYIIMYL